MKIQGMQMPECAELMTGGHIQLYIKEKFQTGVRDLREFEKELIDWTEERHLSNHEETKRCVDKMSKK